MHPSPSDRFSAACGLSEPLELEVGKADQEPTRHVFDRPWVVVGRASRATLCLDEEDVSQRHGYLQVVAGRLFALDLESRAGIQIDDLPARAGWIERGQTLHVGPYQVRVVSPRGAEAVDVGQVVLDPIEDRLPVKGPFPVASFDIFEGSVHVARWRVNRILSLVGRSARCRVRLPDTSVSCVHCAVVATPKGVWVVDLLSREGTRLRGEGVQLARLEEGDTLEVGTYRLRISYHSGPHRTRSASTNPEPSREPSTSLQMRSPMNPSSPLPPVVVVRDDHHAGMLAPRGPDASLLMPLMEQFGTMQQQMFDQFQRSMMMMMQMFSTMHQEQVGLVREEMRHFQKATEELQAAQKELRERQATKPAAPPPNAAPAPKPHAQPRPPVNPFPMGQQRPLGSWQAGEAAPQPQPQPQPKPLPVDPPRAEVPASPGQPPEEGDEVHDWLTQRISELESERQSRWQKILSFIRSS